MSAFTKSGKMRVRYVQGEGFYGLLLWQNRTGPVGLWHGPYPTLGEATRDRTHL